MADLAIQQFLKAVVHDHAVATGLKTCTNQAEITAYAASQGFDFSLEEWCSAVDSDFACLSGSEQDAIQAVDPSHWSWAFRQIAPLRAMLMPGA